MTVYCDPILPIDYDARELQLHVAAHVERAMTQRPAEVIDLPTIRRERQRIADAKFYAAFAARRRRPTNEPPRAA